MEKATIKFTDGTEIEVDVNGDSFITDTEPEFPDDMAVVEVEQGDNTTFYHNARVQECASVDNRYWFIILEASQSEILESQVFYTAMMTDTLLEE